MLLCREASARWSYFRFIYPLVCLYLQLACPAWSPAPSARPTCVCCLSLLDESWLLFSHPCGVAHPCISNCFPRDSFRLVALFVGRLTVCFCLVVCVSDVTAHQPGLNKQSEQFPVWFGVLGLLCSHLNTHGRNDFGTTSRTASSCFKPANCWIQSFRALANKPRAASCPLTGKCPLAGSVLFLTPVWGEQENNCPRLYSLMTHSSASISTRTEGPPVPFM